MGLFGHVRVMEGVHEENEIWLRTLGDFYAIAFRPEEAPDQLEFYTTTGELVAIHPVSAVGRNWRQFSIKPGEPEWVLGPVETARLRTFIDPPLR